MRNPAGEMMLEPPKLADDLILAQLSASYDLSVQALEFLPVGNDARAWSYRIETATGTFFLKLRRGAVNRAALFVPRHLLKCGINSVVAPIPANSGGLYARIHADDDYALMLYPFIRGDSHRDMSLSAAQWRHWGRIMRSIHDSSIPPELARYVPNEAFALKWLDKLERVEALLAHGDYDGEAAEAIARIWRENEDVIKLCRRRYLALGARLADRSPEYILCHADIHRANIILDAAGALHIVDWDETVLAPKERDLMFFIDDGFSADATDAFLTGYDDAAVDPLALAYYKTDWVMQEFADYGARVFLTNEFSDAELALATREFSRLFERDDVIDRAWRAYARLLASEEASAANASQKL